jgi:hypothetical protein
MAFGSARERFLHQSAPHDDGEPVSLGAALERVIGLLADPKAVKALAADAQKSLAVIDKARADTAAVGAQGRCLGRLSCNQNRNRPTARRTREAVQGSRG